MRKANLYLILLLLLCPALSKAQELNCQVLINSGRVQQTEKRVFDDMKVAFEAFLNNRKWTEDEFKLEERIKCNLVITIEDQPSIGTFQATVQVQTARPIFGTTYESILLNFADRDWNFNYIESQPLDFNENVFNTNLTAMLAYYAYIMIGLDYDSFSKLGGTPYIEKAWNVVTNAQQSGNTGWQQFESNRNRYWLAENLLNPLMGPLREGLYLYHRQGLDLLQEQPDVCRENVVKALEGLQRVNRRRPNAILTISFFDAKSDELVSLFQEGNMTVRKKAYDILIELDPSNTDRYASVISN